MKIGKILFVSTALLFFIAAYFAQLVQIQGLPSGVLFLIRTFLACIGTAFFFLGFFKSKGQVKGWIIAYVIAVIPLSIMYLLKPNPSVIENFYMTIHRLITTPLLATIVVFANKFQNEHD